MNNVEILGPARPVTTGGYKVDVSRGERNGQVSSEWFNRPDDERYLSLDDLWTSVKGRSERSRSRVVQTADIRVVQTADIRVEALRDGAERLHLVLPKAKEPIAPTHWAFGQLASIVGAPASYLRQLPAPLAGINLQYGLANHRAEQVKTFETEDGRTELRAVTGPDYGRIHDHELVEAVQRIAGNGTGDTRWKVSVRPWSGSTHETQMSRFSEHPTAFISRRSGSRELTAQEQATIFAAREIQARHINRNPVLSSWQAVMDYCAIYADAEIMPMLVSRSLFLAEIAGKGLA